MLSEYGQKMVELVADVVMNPKFPESELERLKANMLRNLAVSLSQPQSLALQKFRAVMYGDHPYGRVFPTDAMVKGYTLDQTRRFYQQTTAPADRVSTWSDGSTNPPSRRRFERPSPRGSKGSAPAPPAPKPSSTRVVHVIDRPGAPQSTVIMGVPTVDPFEPGLHSDDGDGRAARRRVRLAHHEEHPRGQGLPTRPTASCRCATAMRLGRERGRHDDGDGAVDQGDPAEIDRLQAEPPKAEELTGIQNYLAGTYVLQNSSRGGITNQLDYMDLHGCRPPMPAPM